MIYTYLDLSTGHLTEKTREQIELTADNPVRTRETGWPAMSIGVYEYGYFITVPDCSQQSLLTLPDDLAGVMRYAQRLGIPLLRFDSDGDRIDGLPFHEDEDCAQGVHSWVDRIGLLPPDTRCTRCGEAYGHPD
jgi:hypothetical protein